MVSYGYMLQQRGSWGLNAAAMNCFYFLALVFVLLRQNVALNWTSNTPDSLFPTLLRDTASSYLILIIYFYVRNQIAAAFTRKLTIYSYRIYRCRYSERLWDAREVNLDNLLSNTLRYILYLNLDQVLNANTRGQSILKL